MLFDRIEQSLIYINKNMKRIILITTLLLFTALINAQTTNDILNLLVKNGTIKQEVADSIRSEAAIKQKEDDSKKNFFQITSSKPIQIGAYGQFRYQYLQEKGKNDQFAVRRAYLDVKGAITKNWSFRLQADFAFTPKAIDVYTEYKLKDYLNFTIGQQLIPFSLNNITPNTKLELDDRTQAVAAFSSRGGDVLGDNNGRDIGISAFGTLIPIANDLDLIEYRVGLFNGTGINKLDLNDSKDVIGRVVFHPVQGLDFGGSFYSGFTPDSASLNNKTKDILLGKRQRIGAELNYTYKFLNLKGEYIIAKDGDINKNGYYAHLGAFLIKDKIQVVGRYDTYDADSDKAGNLNTNITFGANFIFNPNILLQVGYTIRQEEGTSFDNDIASIQLQISF